GLDPVRGLHAEQWDPKPAAEGVRSGRLDAMFFSGGIPTEAIATLAARVPIALVDLAGYAQLLRHRYGEVYLERTIPPSTYGLGAPTVTAGVADYLVVSPTMPEPLAYWLVRALFEHRDMLATFHQEARRLDRVAAIGTYPLPLHPGAARYYWEAKR